VTWEGTKRLTWNAGDSSSPVISVDSSNGIYLAWSDDTPGNPEIYFRKSTNSGGTWGSVKRLTWEPSDSYSPKIALDSNKTIHIVWQDEIPGNFEIYYKKGTQ
jgi:hypothetical protein